MKDDVLVGLYGGHQTIIDVVDTVNDMQNICNKFIQSGETIRLLPTMGYLHEGRFSLIKKARRKFKSDYKYVNPLQFGPNKNISYVSKRL